MAQTYTSHNENHITHEQIHAMKMGQLQFDEARDTNVRLIKAEEMQNSDAAYAARAGSVSGPLTSQRPNPPDAC